MPRRNGPSVSVPVEGVTVTPIESDEWRVVKALRLRALANSPDSFGSTLARETEFDVDDWQRLLGRGQWFCASSGRAPIGMVAVLPPAPCSPGEAHMISFWVDPSLRGTRTAATLVDAACAHARSAGASKLVLWVSDKSKAARRFYDRMGFVGTGVRQPLPSNPAIGEELLQLCL